MGLKVNQKRKRSPRARDRTLELVAIVLCVTALEVTNLLTLGYDSALLVAIVGGLFYLAGYETPHGKMGPWGRISKTILHRKPSQG